jgi:hypothetical protein
MYASVLNTDGKQVWMASQPPSQLEQSAAAYQEPVYAACEAPSSRNRPSPSALQSLPFRTSSLATIYGSTNAAYHQTENWGSKVAKHVAGASWLGAGCGHLNSNSACLCCIVMFLAVGRCSDTTRDHCSTRHLWINTTCALRACTQHSPAFLL